MGEHNTDQEKVRVLGMRDASPKFAQLWESVLFDPELSSTAKVVYAVLQRMIAYGHDEWPSQTAISRLAGVSREAVNDALKLLASNGHIARKSRPGLTDEVVLTPPGGCGKLAQPLWKIGTTQASTPIYREIESKSHNSNPEPATTARSSSSPKARKTAILQSWRPPANLYAQTQEMTGWDDARINREIFKFVTWHQEHATKRADWAASWRQWVKKSQQFESEREARHTASLPPGDDPRGGLA